MNLATLINPLKEAEACAGQKPGRGILWAGMVCAALLCGLTFYGLVTLLLKGAALLPLTGALPLSAVLVLAATCSILFFISAVIYVNRAWVIAAPQEQEEQDKEDEQFRFLVDNAADILARHGSDGCISYISPACRSLLGYAPEAFMGEKFQTIVHPDDVHEVENAFNRASHFGGDCSVEYRLYHANGDEIWVETICRPVFSLSTSRLSPTLKSLPSPQCFEVISITRDMSARKAQEAGLQAELAQAEEANQAKSRFLANMSHELRTPLNAIIGFSEMITTQTFGPIGSSKYAEYAELIHRSGHHLLTLINDILDLAKIEAGKFQLLIKNIDVPKLIEETANLVTVTAEKAAVSIDFLIEDEMPPCRGDERALKQILLNLVSNALKFTPAGGQVVISASVRNANLCLQVVDTGAGIAEKDLERLGKPFEQVKNDKTKDKMGTGLGLSLVKSLTALHGGSVEISSTLGKGTCVTVRIPLEEAGATVTDLSTVLKAVDAQNTPTTEETMRGAA